MSLRLSFEQRFYQQSNFDFLQRQNDGLAYLVTISEEDSKVVGIDILGKRASQVAIGISAA